jgi:hypothetical protein
MKEAERIWREKSDEDLLDAAAELDDFTEEGRDVIRAELKRRGLEDPVEQAGGEGSAEPEVPAIECLRCRTPLEVIESSDDSPTLQWRGRRVPMFDPTGLLHIYACPHCGHVELFFDLPQEEGGE